ncbi:MAG: CRISPR-associated endonuclease Cas2, partial [Patescibacteria group bacterium]|nr:CRISPR-associated endonuclease Cas2 [Patescibacteria group bacterium]
MLKSASSKLLFLIAAFTKSPKDYIDVLSSPLPRISGYPKRDKTVKAAVNTLIDQNKIEYRKQGETIFIKPSRKGYEELSSSVPYYKSYLLRWDERFRLIFYDIPEDKRSKRDAIRRILTNYNLGRLQNSVWLSVYDVDDLKAQLKKAGLLSYIYRLNPP